MFKRMAVGAAAAVIIFTGGGALPADAVSGSGSAKGYPWYYGFCSDFNPGWICP